MADPQTHAKPPDPTQKLMAPYINTRTEGLQRALQALWNPLSKCYALICAPIPNGSTLLEFVEEVPDFLNLSLDERLDGLGFLGDFLCGYRGGLTEDLGEVRCAASVPSQDLPNRLAPASNGGIRYQRTSFAYILGV